ncbi:MAG: hypothetical protein IJQ37_06510 [Clostridia bacterium]|nr:hypothetical protein [Clostridia bacterium]
MRIKHKAIICVCLVTVAVILGIIAYTALKPKTDIEQTASEPETTATATENGIPMIEPIEPVPTETASSVVYDDPRISVDENGGVHIDVGGTSNNGHIDEPHISGEIYVVPGVKGDDTN